MKMCGMTQVVFLGTSIALIALMSGCASTPEASDATETSKSPLKSYSIQSLISETSAGLPREILSLPGYCSKALGFGEKTKGSGEYRLMEIVYLCSSGSPTINNGDKLQVILPDGRGGYETDSTGKPVIHNAIKLPDRIELTH